MSALSLKNNRQLSLSATSAQEKNFGLSEPEFKKLLACLQDGDQRLFEKVFFVHFEDCMSYLKRKDRASHEDAYDATMDAYLHFRSLLVAKKINYGNLRYLLTRMARQHFQRRQKRGQIFTELPDFAGDLGEEEADISTEDYDLLSRAFQSLGSDCRELLKAFYYARRSLKEIAHEEARGAPAVRKQKSRCIATLKRYFNQLS
ncbi:RNA polymerase sigma factor [Neolewinella persica]|uniref:RNA polymerase sigma factor n=1 Tax=Neolewinella persica TaxID=70998 RepID=UPI00036F7AD6|nr:sigma-70 family RNA polymerase sigma factor [Neolewinella persica]